MWGSCVLELPEELFVGKVWLLVESFLTKVRVLFFLKKDKSTFKYI